MESCFRFYFRTVFSVFNHIKSHFEQGVDALPPLAAGGDTIDNILQIAERQDAALTYYYTDEDGALVTYSLYNVSGADPADFIGEEFFEQGQQGEGEEEGEEEEVRTVDQKYF